MPSSQVMEKWETGRLKSHGKVVKSQKQAVAIMLSERRAEQAHGGEYPDQPRKRMKPRKSR